MSTYCSMGPPTQLMSLDCHRTSLSSHSLTFLCDIPCDKIILHVMRSLGNILIRGSRHGKRMYTLNTHTYVRIYFSLPPQGHVEWGFGPMFPFDLGGHSPSARPNGNSNGKSNGKTPLRSRMGFHCTKQINAYNFWKPRSSQGALTIFFATIF